MEWRTSPVHGHEEQRQHEERDEHAQEEFDVLENLLPRIVGRKPPHPATQPFPDSRPNARRRRSARARAILLLSEATENHGDAEIPDQSCATAGKT